MTTDKQVLANRRNAQLGGVRTAAGKDRSKLNARRHGILAVGITPHEGVPLRRILSEFHEDLKPEGAIEEALVEKLALTYLQLQRCARAEAQWQRTAWWPVQDDGRFRRLVPGTDLRPAQFEKIATVIARYDTTLTNRFLKLLKTLEERQKARGETADTCSEAEAPDGQAEAAAPAEPPRHCATTPAEAVGPIEEPETPPARAAEPAPQAAPDAFAGADHGSAKRTHFVTTDLPPDSYEIAPPAAATQDRPARRGERADGFRREDPHPERRRRSRSRFV